MTVYSDVFSRRVETRLSALGAPIVRSRGGLGGVSDFRVGTKGREFWEILGERVGGVPNFGPWKEKNVRNIL